MPQPERARLQEELQALEREQEQERQERLQLQSQIWEVVLASWEKPQQELEPERREQRGLEEQLGRAERAVRELLAPWEGL